MSSLPVLSGVHPSASCFSSSQSPASRGAPTSGWGSGLFGPWAQEPHKGKGNVTASAPAALSTDLWTNSSYVDIFWGTPFSFHFLSLKSTASLVGLVYGTCSCKLCVPASTSVHVYWNLHAFFSCSLWCSASLAISWLLFIFQHWLPDHSLDVICRIVLLLPGWNHCWVSITF